MIDFHHFEQNLQKYKLVFITLPGKLIITFTEITQAVNKSVRVSKTIKNSFGFYMNCTEYQLRVQSFVTPLKRQGVYVLTERLSLLSNR